MDLNTINVVGRLAADPSLKLYAKTDGTEGARTFFRLAVTRLSDRGKKDRAERRANFIPVVCWGNLAKIVAQFVTKGTEVALSGELIAESQKQEDGTYKEYIHILATDVQFGRKPGKNAGTGDASNLQAQIDELRSNLSDNASPMTATAGNPFSSGS